MQNHDTAAVKGGLLEKLMRISTDKQSAKVCRDCGNLLQVSDTALGCAAHDKLILPDYPPYHGNMVCKDWT